jgi:hypothetical protein
MPVNWHFQNRLVPKSDEVRSGPTPYRRANAREMSGFG